MVYKVKRYANRKLYDTIEARYLNLVELELVFKTETDVRVHDHNGLDITGQYMLACIANKEENSQNLNVLNRILKEQNGVLL